MKNLIIILICLIFCPDLLTGQVKATSDEERYEALYEGDLPQNGESMKRHIVIINDHFKALSKLKLNKLFVRLQQEWKKIENDFNTYSSMNPDLRINHDFTNIINRLIQFRKDAINYKPLIFPDETLKRNVEKILKDKSSEGYGIPFFTTTDTTLTGTYKLAREQLDSTKNLRNSLYKQYDSIAGSYNKLREETGSAFSKLSEVTNRIEALMLKTKKDTDSLKYFTFKRDTTCRLGISAQAFSYNVFGLNAFYALSPPHKGMHSLVLAADFFPRTSRSLSKAGFAFNAGIQYRFVTWQAGIIYLNKVNESQDVSWKAALIYHIAGTSLLIGASYSPLTQPGIMIGYTPGFKLNHKKR